MDHSSESPASTNGGTAAAVLTAPTTAPRLLIRSATKTFHGKAVLSDASLTVAAGEIHGLIGQNGSGKSTLIKMLSGFHTSDAGTHFEVDGEALEIPVRPKRLRELGVSFVHQDLGLDERATVMDNVRVGRYRPNRMTRSIDIASECERVAESLEMLGADIDPRAYVSDLSVTQRSIVAIARALQDYRPGFGCIVFDESTQSLPSDALDDVYAVIRRVASAGTAVVIVSHRLEEVLALTDRVTILRDGRVVETVDTADSTELSLTRTMLARDSVAEKSEGILAGSGRGGVVLRARGLSSASLQNLSFEAHSGEVLGIIGSAESGYSGIPKLLSGAKAAEAGTVQVEDVVLDATRPRVTDFLSAGIIYIPEDRREHGVATGLSILENLTLPRLTQKSRFRVSRAWQLTEFGWLTERFGLSAPSPDATVSVLSGGNQQKVLLAKWLLSQPRVVVAHEPTQAVDVGARREILATLRSAADGGAAVVVVSNEAEDLATLCDRVIVLRDGEPAQELHQPLQAHAILESVYGELPERIAGGPE